MRSVLRADGATLASVARDARIEVIVKGNHWTRWGALIPAFGAARVGSMLALALLSIGCATAPVGTIGSKHGATVGPSSKATGFHESLAVCRFWKGGRVNRRRNTPATDPYIAACLARKGWTPDGLPIDLLGPRPAITSDGPAVADPSRVDSERGPE